MQTRTLRLLDKNKRKTYVTKSKTKSDAVPSYVNINDNADGIYGGWFSKKKKKEEDTDDVYQFSGKNDEENQAEISEEMEQYEEAGTMQSYIQSMIDLLTVANTNDTSINKKGTTDTSINAANGQSDPQEVQQESPGSFDPRVVRYDAFKSAGALIPFASDTAASVYYDMVFSVEKAVAKMDPNYARKDQTGTDGYQASDRVAPNTEEVNKLKKDPDFYGTQSMMSPYCVTRLVGGLTGDNKNFTTHMYDVRDLKRFYDHAGFGNGNIIETSDDFVSITNPTTTNIITWSNKDRWGRTPYSFQDFVFCKYWNIIPNNRMITLRKYAVPTYDNLNFPGMDDHGIDAAGEENRSTTDPNEIKRKTIAPIATVVAYFGGQSPNKLGDFINFSTGTPWKDLTADVHQVQGDTGDDPRAVIDRMFEHTGGFGGQGSDSNIINNFLTKSGGLTGQYFSFAKFVGLLSPDGYSGHSQAAFERLTQANVDPTDLIYSNRIYGPVNRITTVKKREPGIEFSQSFKLVCEYVARPIGGVNMKAVMLDILSNCMEMASPEAVFWGGGYKFMIKPHMYPFKNTALKNNVMASLYAGKIFGKDGAISNMLSGLKTFATDTNGNFDWSSIAGRIGDILGQTVGAVGSMLQSVSSTLFGEQSTLSQWFGDVTKNVAGEDNAEAGKKKVQKFANNLNKMWKDHVIQQTAMPSISGMKALLTGDPVGNWHMTVGNPLNPIMVVGNLICTKMQIEMDDELGPDDFPVNLKVTYTIEHGMPRDKAAIQSMFNRGAGKIYKLPDYVRATSDYETKVDDYTGMRYLGESWQTPAYMNASALMNRSGAGGYQTMKYDVPKLNRMGGNTETMFVAKFTPPDPQRATEWQFSGGSTSANAFLSRNKDSRSIYFPNLHTQKSTDN